MSNIGFATLTVVPSTAGFGAALSRETDGHTRKAGESGGKAFGGGLVATAGKFVAPLAAIFAGGAALGFFKNAITEASGLGESMNALRVVYGQNAGAITELGRASAQSLGLSNLEFNNLAVRFSSFSKTIAGEGGSLHAFDGLDIAERTYIHINNTNPILVEGSEPRQIVEAAGWRVARDGMEIEL